MEKELETSVQVMKDKSANGENALEKYENHSGTERSRLNRQEINKIIGKESSLVDVLPASDKDESFTALSPEVPDGSWWILPPRRPYSEAVSSLRRTSASPGSCNLPLPSVQLRLERGICSSTAHQRRPPGATALPPPQPKTPVRWDAWMRNTVLPCQDQYFVGGQNYNCPYSSATTSESSVDVSRETLVSFWAAGLLDDKEPQQAPQAQESSSDSNFQVLDSCSWEEDQLSSQLYRNKQLQDTLVQKEEELARLHEENNHLKQYLNSALVKCLEEKAKKLLSSDELYKAYGKFRSGKRKPKEQRYCSVEIPHPKNAKRNLSSEFAACEKQPGPSVDPWVLQTLGLKDLNTIDDTLSANYSASSFHPTRISSAFHQFPDDAISYENAPREDLLIDYGSDRTTSLQHTASHRESFHFLPQLPNPPGGEQALQYYTADVSPNKTEVAFSTSLSPHCNVKTHSFHQGQAFVRRDEEGGWKFTWVPKQS
ncbi:PREDICTED: geminin coiled-coil domain-containing protein 1 [Elephantulus edwardii]|uniref:geminin coiled-coil domain-containing protein 1 n=1 Tax=Elephantulus edwardii TaxID=28737 RepID=UPI0003F09EFA|nr:PREDICTED: geminin coiled-coil domain-containing protein 1 [Elephantulus edwardii]